MLFLSKPLELEWNKTMHVKIGRTILTLKAKKNGNGQDPDLATMKKTRKGARVVTAYECTGF